MSPADSRTMSPGTSVSIGISAECTGRGAGAAFDGGRGAHHGSQARRRLVRAVLLDEGGRDRQHDHDGDDNALP